jgi:hypothetical protein
MQEWTVRLSAMYLCPVHAPWVSATVLDTDSALWYADSMRAQTRLLCEGVGQFTRTAVNLPRNIINSDIVFGLGNGGPPARSLTLLLHAS